MNVGAKTAPSQDLSPARRSREHADFLAHALSDFGTFCGLLRIRDKRGVDRPFVLRRIQREYVKNRTNRDFILKARQVFMTTVLLALDLWTFITQPGAHVVILCQSSKDGGATGPRGVIAEPLQKFFQSLRDIGLALPLTKSSTFHWEMKSRDASMIIRDAGASLAAAEKVGRSGRITRLHATEVAMFEYPHATMRAILSAVPPPEMGSEVVIESTPKGAVGYFAQKWKSIARGEDPHYKGHFFPWWMHEEYQTPLQLGETYAPSDETEKDLSPQQIKFIRDMVRSMGADAAAQEFPSDPESCFLGSGSTFFDKPSLTQLLAKARRVEPLEMFGIKRMGANGIVRFTKLDRPVSHGDAVSKTGHGFDGTFRVWAKPEKGRSYVISADPAQGVGLDNAAAIVLERGTGTHAATLWGNFKPEELARLLVIVATSYNDAEIAPERNNHGHVVLNNLGVGHAAIDLKAPWPNTFVDLDGKPGWNTTPTSRVLAIDVLDEAIRLGYVKTLDVELLSECLSFVTNERGKAEAGAGAHDDLVICMAIAWSVICRRRGLASRDFSQLPIR